MKGVVALILGGLLSGCAIADAPTIPTPNSTNEYAPGQQPYGAKGSITQQQLAALQGLAWPQTYDDMVSSFGYPAHRTETGDYYQLEGTGNWVVIEDSGPEATGYRAE
jgi:hypothetical protein